MGCNIATNRKGEISMAEFERERLAEDVMERFDALSEYEQQAVEAIMKAKDYSIEEALDIVEKGDYVYIRWRI